MGAALAFAFSHTKTADSHIQATLKQIWHTHTCNHRHTPVKVMIAVCLFVLAGFMFVSFSHYCCDDRNCMQTHLRAEHAVGQVWIRCMSCSMSEIKIQNDNKLNVSLLL